MRNLESKSMMVRGLLQLVLSVILLWAYMKLQHNDTERNDSIHIDVSQNEWTTIDPSFAVPFYSSEVEPETKKFGELAFHYAIAKIELKEKLKSIFTTTDFQYFKN
jgi:hypothetical protein